jgi:mRNA interferase MazF
MVDTNDNDLIVARVTTGLYSSVYDVMINHWRDAGLLAPSVIRTHKLATLGKGLVERELGVLGTEDFEKFKKVFNENIIV